MSIAGAVGVWLMLVGGLVCLGAGALAAAAFVGWAAGKLRDQILTVGSLREISVALRYWKASGSPRPSAQQPAGQPVQAGGEGDD